MAWSLAEVERSRKARPTWDRSPMTSTAAESKALWLDRECMSVLAGTSNGYTDREVGERASLEGPESRYLIRFTHRFVLEHKRA